jgi:hypothetical protein
VSSLSAVGLAARQSTFDQGSTTDLLRPLTTWERLRLPLGLALMALGVGAAAYAITRTATRDKEPPAVAVPPPAPATGSATTEPSAPRVGLDALPVESSTPPSDVTMEPTPDPTTAARPRGNQKATPGPAPTGTTPTGKKKPSWRQDPGF